MKYLSVFLFLLLFIFIDNKSEAANRSNSIAVESDTTIKLHSSLFKLGYKKANKFYKLKHIEQEKIYLENKDVQDQWKIFKKKYRAANIFAVIGGIIVVIAAGLGLVGVAIGIIFLIWGTIKSIRCNRMLKKVIALYNEKVLK
jgi:hypothetical protein